MGCKVSSNLNHSMILLHRTPKLMEKSLGETHHTRIRRRRGRTGGFRAGVGAWGQEAQKALPVFVENNWVKMEVHLKRSYLLASPFANLFHGLSLVLHHRGLGTKHVAPLTHCGHPLPPKGYFLTLQLTCTTSFSSAQVLVSAILQPRGCYAGTGAGDEPHN